MHMSLERVQKPFFIGVSVFVVMGIITITALLLAPKNPLPGTIRKQANFVILAPVSGPAAVDRESAKYDTSLKLLSYNVALDGVQVVVSQQPTPESFSDIPQVYDKVLSNMNEYLKFDVIVGTVHVTRPKDLAGKQAAVMNTKGTLFFAKPDKDLSEEQWRRFFKGIDTLR
jgi:hypothetical protein